MCKQCEPSVPVTRLIGRSDIGDSFGRVKDAASNNIHNIITLSRSFAWNYVAVCGGRISLKILVKDSSDMWKYLKSESAIMFVEPLMCWKCRYT